MSERSQRIASNAAKKRHGGRVRGTEAVLGGGSASQQPAQSAAGKGNGGLKISNEEVSLEGFIEKLCSYSTK